eukprot:gene5370-2833_t
MTRMLREVGTAAARIAVGPPAPPPPPADPKVPPPPPPAGTSKAARWKERRQRREEAREKEPRAASPAHSTGSDWGIPSDADGCAALSTPRLAAYASRLVRRSTTTGDDDAFSRVRHSQLICDELAARADRDPAGAAAVPQGPMSELSEMRRRVWVRHAAARSAAAAPAAGYAGGAAGGGARSAAAALSAATPPRYPTPHPGRGKRHPESATGASPPREPAAARGRLSRRCSAGGGGSFLL